MQELLRSFTGLAKAISRNAGGQAETTEDPSGATYA